MSRFPCYWDAAAWLGAAASLPHPKAPMRPTKRRETAKRRSACLRLGRSLDIPINSPGARIIPIAKLAATMRGSMTRRIRTTISTTSRNQARFRHGLSRSVCGSGTLPIKYKIEIQHNSDPPVPGHGSAIFFHIRRGPDRPTHGCTTMPESELTRVIAWLREDNNPHYVVLPKAEYDQLQGPWGLPTFR